jgi:hypothetical protein
MQALCVHVFRLRTLGPPLSGIGADPFLSPISSQSFSVSTMNISVHVWRVLRQALAGQLSSSCVCRPLSTVTGWIGMGWGGICAPWSVPRLRFHLQCRLVSAMPLIGSAPCRDVQVECFWRRPPPCNSIDPAAMRVQLCCVCLTPLVRCDAAAASAASWMALLNAFESALVLSHALARVMFDSALPHVHTYTS